MLLHQLRIKQTSASGAWSFNSPRFSSAILKQIVLKAATAQTTFTLTITNEFGDVVYTNDTAATGTLRQEMDVPLKGIHTIAVSSASADELFVGCFAILEGVA